MKLVHRIGYYLVGLSLGIVIVSFVFSGKKTTCNYGPNARVLADLKKKKLLSKPLLQIEGKTLDSLVFRELLERSKVNFSKSNTQLDSCKIYRVESNYKGANYWLDIENCTRNVRVMQLERQ